MGKRLKVGILREENVEWEKRTPLVPEHVKSMVAAGISVEVESSGTRCYADAQYERSGARITEKAVKSDILLGIKAPAPSRILRGRTYMVFSHTVKGQSAGIPLLRTLAEKKASLIDYEKITDREGRRLVYFGRFAGICGLVDSLVQLGLKYAERGIDTPFTMLEPAWKYVSYDDIKKAMRKVGRHIRKKGLDKRITPVIIGITGCGNVSRGVREILAEICPEEVHPVEALKAYNGGHMRHDRLYSTMFMRERKFRHKDGRAFYFEDYLEKPVSFVSDMDRYLPILNMLVHTSYWEKGCPRLVTRKMLRELFSSGKGRLAVIGDISCDIRGSIEITRRATTQEHPVFSYEPLSGSYVSGISGEGITVMAVDNLPAELPVLSSLSFSGMIKEYIRDMACARDKKLAGLSALRPELGKAVILERGKFTPGYSYLRKYTGR